MTGVPGGPFIGLKSSTIYKDNSHLDPISAHGLFLPKYPVQVIYTHAQGVSGPMKQTSQQTGFSIQKMSIFNRDRRSATVPGVPGGPIIGL